VTKSGKSGFLRAYCLI